MIALNHAPLVSSVNNCSSYKVAEIYGGFSVVATLFEFFFYNWKRNPLFRHEERVRYIRIGSLIAIAQGLSKADFPKA